MKPMYALALMTVLLAGPACAQQTVLVADLVLFPDDTVNLSKLEVRYGRPEPLYEFEGTHRAQILDASGNVIWEKDFIVSYEAHPVWSGDPENEPHFVNEYTYEYLVPPYSPLMHTLRVLRGNAVIFTKNIASELCNNDRECNNNENYLSCRSDCGDGSTDFFCDRVEDGVCDGDCERGEDPDCLNAPSASGCGNNVCQSSETFATCPQDCPSGGADKYCDGQQDNVCDPDCRAVRDPDCPQVSGPSSSDSSVGSDNFLWLILLIVVGIAMVGIVLFLRKKNPPASPPPTVQQQYQRMQNYYPPGSVPGRYRMPPRR